MHRHALRFALGLVICLAPRFAMAVGPTVGFTLPATDTTPSVFGTLPFPNDLYFDQGKPGDGDGTLLNTGATIGLSVDVVRENSASFEDAFDLLDGFGTTTAIFFFLDGPIDVASLPSSPVLSPALTDAVFCADAATAAPVPIALRFDVDTRIPNVLAVLPLPGRPLAAKSAYTCVVRRSVTGGGDPVEPSADWTSVRDGASTNPDADALYDPVVTTLGGAGVAASDIAGMTVFTTGATVDDLVAIHDTILPALPVPTANFTSRPELVFDTPAELVALVGSSPHSNIATIATGFYESPRFQTHDPDGDGFLGDLPNPAGFITCLVTCETTDERFTHDVSGLPVVLDTPEIPFTVVIPNGTPPPGGWPVIIQQHGLGGQRDTVLAFGDGDAAAGFASIGIDAAQHGYRYLDCGPSAPCPQDVKNFVGGTAVPDGFIDNDFNLGPGLGLGFLSVNLGFFQAFHNFLGIRDNFRQTYADLISLVRLLQGHSIDAALGAPLDSSRIFYMGHSLGGLMGSGFVPIEADLSASLLNATGGGLTSQLFINSSIGAGAQGLVTGILGLDPANVVDQFALQPNLTQMIIDPADGINSASLLLNPVSGGPRNVIQVEDFGDQVVPNQANEVLAVAGGLPIFDPFVQNLHQNPFTLAVTPTHGTIEGNIAGVTAALLQNGPATHAASLSTGPGTLTFVPEFAHPEEVPITMQGFPNLERGIRIANAGILPSVLDWFRDVADNGPPGRFTFTKAPNFNPIQNEEAPMGASTLAFFARTVSAGGAAPFSEPTPDVTVDLVGNTVESRVTAGRTILGTEAQVNDRDVPPGPQSGVGTPGILPFFATAQRGLPGLFTASVTLAYTPLELAIAGIPAGSADEAALVVGTFTPGTCAVGTASCSENGDCGANGPCLGAGYTVHPTTVNTTLHTATATGLSSFSTFAVLHPDALAGGYRPPLVPGGANRRRGCWSELQVLNATNTPFLDSRGLVNALQVCRDGDAACDADRTVDGTCSFRLGVCLGAADATLPACTPGTTLSYTLRRPLPLSPDATDAANAQAVLAALVALGGTQGGTRQNVVSYDPALAAGTCTGLATFRVPTEGTAAGTRVLRGRVRQSGGAAAADRVRLRCEPAA
jgi:hypothetical protein